MIRINAMDMYKIILYWNDASRNGFFGGIQTRINIQMKDEFIRRPGRRLRRRADVFGFATGVVLMRPQARAFTGVCGEARGAYKSSRSGWG